MATKMYFTNGAINQTYYITPPPKANPANPAMPIEQPARAITFTNQMLRVSDPALQDLIEGDPIFGTTIFLDSEETPAPVKQPTVKYTQGAANTASEREASEVEDDASVTLTDSQKSAVTRAIKKLDAGKNLTELEQQSIDKAKALGIL